MRYVGRCVTESLLPRSVATVVSTSPPGADVCDHPSSQILLAGSLVVATSQDNSLGPVLSLVTSSNTKHTLSCQTPRSTISTQVTAVALDQSPPTSSHHARLAAFLSTGEFVVFSINHSSPSQSSRLFTYQPITRVPRTAPIVQAVFHDRLLITLSQSFHLSLYDLSAGTIVHTQTLSSFTSYPPSSMVLTPTSPSTYKLILAYAIPVFPAHWSVGATEIVISSEPSMVVMSSRTTRAMDVPNGWIDEQRMRTLREQWSRKVERVADTQTDGKWVVLAPSEALVPPTQTSDTSLDDCSVSTAPSSPFKSSSLHSPNALQLYRLYFPASTSGASVPKLTFVRSLYGQIGPVTALSLADGRCVSLGVNGSIWVWDLEAGSGAEVFAGRSVTDTSLAARVNSAILKGSVVFDERRIISADTNGVEVRRFDV